MAGLPDDRAPTASQGAGRYATPEQVMAAEDLSGDEKRRRLEELRGGGGGPGDEPNLATRIARALAFLDEDTGAQPTCHDQGFYTAIGDIGKEGGR